MKKIAILTLDSVNFGNKLQNYALQILLQKQGFYVKTLTYPRSKLKNIFKPFYSFVLRHKVKRWSFYSFRKKISWGESMPQNSEQWKKLQNKYDYIVVGSDQVWNTVFFNKPLYFLPGVDKNKRIAFAASFGINYVVPQLESVVKKELKNFFAISVRETSGADLVEKLIGYRPPVIIDPTLNIDAFDWYKIEKKPFYFRNNEEFVLIYFLGNKTSEYIKIINSIKEKYDFDIIDISDSSLDNKKNIGPSEFLFLIHHASLILTDSFHGTVFSILFDKPFYVFERYDKLDKMNSRIETLFKTLKIQNRYSYNFDINNLFLKDYSIAYSQIEIEKRKVENFIKNSFAK